MNYSLSTKNIDLSDRDKELLGEKLDRLTKLMTPPYRAEVMVRHDTHHRSGQVVSCRLNLHFDGKIFHAEREAEYVQNALDDTIAALRNELIKHRKRRKRGRTRLRNFWRR